MSTLLPLTNSLPALGSSPVDTSAATTYTDINGLAALKKDPSSPQSISAVAEQVEALFLQMMLKSMRDATASDDPDGNEMGMYQAMFDKQVPLTLQRAAAAVGVNPLGLRAQAALETGWGQRTPRTADGSSSLNLFGIKAGDEWTGGRATADTVEFSNGVATPRRTAFRAYGSIEESVSDFANLLKNSPRYRDAIAAGGDVQAYIRSIGKSGYATDPEYANKLNQILNSRGWMNRRRCA